MSKLNSDNLKRKYYNKFIEFPTNAPTTSLEIAMLSMFKHSYRVLENSFIGGFITRHDFINKILFLNRVVSKTCHELEIDFNCIVVQSVTGEYLKPNKMPRKINDINIEEFFIQYESDFKKVERVFEKVKRDMIQYKKEATEKDVRKFEYYRIE